MSMRNEHLVAASSASLRDLKLMKAQCEAGTSVTLLIASAFNVGVVDTIQFRMASSVALGSSCETKSEVTS